MMNDKVVFPLNYAGLKVTAWVCGEQAGKWMKLLDRVDSPDCIEVADVKMDRRYLLEIWVENTESGEIVNAYCGSFIRVWSVPVSFEWGENTCGTMAQPDKGVECPTEFVRVSEFDGTMTLKLYTFKDGILSEIPGVRGGEVHTFRLSEWNCWHWISGWSEGDGRLVFSRWIRHAATSLR